MNDGRTSDGNWGAEMGASINTAGEGYYRSVKTPEETFSEAIIRSVSEASGIEPTSLDIFNDAIDADALNSILNVQGNQVEVKFSYSGYQVRVHSDWSIEVRHN